MFGTPEVVELLRENIIAFCQLLESFFFFLCSDRTCVFSEFISIAPILFGLIDRVLHRVTFFLFGSACY